VSKEKKMPNLKPYYDAAFKADEEVKRILAEMDTLFNDGTEEGKQKALQLRPALDEAQAEAKEANQLYTSMRDASLVNDSMASLFTTPADPASQARDESPKIMKLSEFHALSPRERLAFAKSGGALEEEK
jgi:hypothetical protein